MIFATTKGKFTALILVALRVASVSAAPAPAVIAVYDAADAISEGSFAAHAAPVVDASVMFPSDDTTEWADISAVAADARVVTLEYADADDDSLEDLGFKARRPISRPKSPKRPIPKRPTPKRPTSRPKSPKRPKFPSKSKPRTGIRLPPLRIRVPLPRIKIPGLGRLPLPEHIDIGIASKGGKKGGKSGKGAAPGGRKPLGSDPRTWSPSAKGKGRGAVDAPRTPRGGRPASQVAQRKGKGRTSCACAEVVIVEEFDLENTDFVGDEIEMGQFTVEAVADDGVDVEVEDMIADDEAAEDEEMDTGLADEEHDFGTEEFNDVEFAFEEFDDAV